MYCIIASNVDKTACEISKANLSYFVEIVFCRNFVTFILRDHIKMRLDFFRLMVEYIMAYGNVS